MGKGGSGAGRKLRKQQRRISRKKSTPLGCASHAKGIVVEQLGIEAKQPNSGIRKCVRVKLIKNGKSITALVPKDGCLNYISENDEVLVTGLGKTGDIPGVHYQVVSVAGVSLVALYRGLHYP